MSGEENPLSAVIPASRAVGHFRGDLGAFPRTQSCAAASYICSCSALSTTFAVENSADWKDSPLDTYLCCVNGQALCDSARQSGAEMRARRRRGTQQRGHVGGQEGSRAGG